MNQPRYYANEFENTRKINGAFLFLVLALLAALTHGAMLWCGIQIGRAVEREEQRIGAAQRKAATPAALKADWTQFKCSELAAICRQRYQQGVREAAR